MAKLFSKLNRYRKYILFFCDFVLWNISYYLSFTIIRNSYFITGLENTFFVTFLVMNASFIIVFLAFRLYDKIWRYADVEDFFYVGIVCTVANIVFFLVTLLMDNRYHLGMRTHVLFLLMTIFSLFVIRLLYRINRIYMARHASKKPMKRMMIVGGGDAAVTIIHELEKSPANEYLPICIADDDKAKIGRKVCGIKVEGTTEEIPQLCKKEHIQVILFSISNIGLEDKKRILNICAKTNIEVKIIPSLYDLVTAKKTLTSQIRQVEVEDLLGREPVVFDTEKYGKYLENQTVLVTGGGGSIGSELCRQIAKVHPKKLIILDIYENNAYAIQQELIRKKIDIPMEVQIASVSDAVKLDQLFSQKRIDVVFHAAAHKHVPLMETNPEEAIKNNVIGTLNLVRVADKYHVKKFVQISTDKAVNPTNVMGATKRICEMIIQTMNRHSQTEFVAVRFGNVLGSNGSVIPLFKEQIRCGGPVTVTHPDIIRYFMTIPEAVSLVLTAGGLAKGGEIFVLDMGQPVKIKDLAENLIRLSGYRPGEDIKIEYSGLRPGEKLFEELLMNEEGMTQTDNKKIYIGKPIEIDEEKFFQELNTLHHYAEADDKSQILHMLAITVPTFHHRP